jgi:replicative DNA helicase
MHDEPIFDDGRHDQWMAIAKELYRRTFAEEAPEAIFDWLMTKVSKLKPATLDNALMTWQDSFAIYDAEIARRTALAQLPVGERKLFTWPWSSWNKFIDPAESGTLIVIGGPDGAGKSSYAECISEHWANQGYKVVYVHFELSRIIMLDRRACRHTSIARRRLKLANDLTGDDLKKLAAAKERLQQWPGEITYLHTPGKTIELVLRELTALHAAGKCDVAVIDYLEKAKASSAQLKAFGANIFAREADDVELLKSWAEDEAHETPMLVLSQFSKAGKNASFKDLDRTDIRGAGEKTEKANVVILLHPDKDHEGVIDVRLDKNTLGPKGVFQQFLDGPNFNVGDIAR